MKEKEMVLKYYELLYTLYYNKKFDTETLNILLNNFSKIKEIIKKSIDN